LNPTEPLHFVTTYTLDVLGREQSLQTPDGATRTWQRNASGQVTLATDALNRRTVYTYTLVTAVSELTRVDYADHAYDTYKYDPVFHQVTEHGDALGHVTRYELNDQGDVREVMDALEQSTESSWSGGLLRSTTDARGNTTSYTYDLGRRLRSVEDALHHFTTY